MKPTIFLALLTALLAPLAQASRYDQRLQAYNAEESARYVQAENEKLAGRIYQLNRQRLAAFQHVINRHGYKSCEGECSVRQLRCDEGRPCRLGYDNAKAAFPSLGASDAYLITSCKLDFPDGYSCNVYPSYRTDSTNSFASDCVNDARQRQTTEFTIGGGPDAKPTRQKKR